MTKIDVDSLTELKFKENHGLCKALMILKAFLSGSTG